MLITVMANLPIGSGNDHQVASDNVFENTMNVTNNRTLEDEEKNSRKPKGGITLPKGRDEQRQYQTGYLSPLILGGWSILFINNSKKTVSLTAREC
ncbi:hypothetical protein QWZ16_05105 [Vibrio ostreicida]|uniref:Uncharacterized protein n=1 Tax=Vibrio ostreicida TaxID=526588 RepID=A0ABT8BQK3_9VIBR|nr:hypothetical protein [Vibrio ostreicida]MDN3609102.1 hypothetical protein [Vibrio ostreicida]